MHASRQVLVEQGDQGSLLTGVGDVHTHDVELRWYEVVEASRPVAHGIALVSDQSGRGCFECIEFETFDYFYSTGYG